MRRDELRFFLLVVPALAYIAFFVVYPAFRAVYSSFVLPNGRFSLYYYRFLESVGLGKAVVDTIIVTVGALAVQLALALAVASLLTKEFKGKRAVSTIMITPMGVATVVAAVTFSFIFEVTGGYANSILHLFGLRGINWYANDAMSLLVVILSDAWKNTPIVALILLAGMTAIPQDLYYAAAVDGAGPIRRFFYITLPNLREFIAIALIIRGVQEFNIFALPLILIGYHPPLLTTLIYELYTTSFPDVGPSLAAATILLVFILAFLVLILRVRGR
jgi:ABC-type sugar transport system permease subunit